jgi:hypothetical protein
MSARAKAASGGQKRRLQFQCKASRASSRLCGHAAIPSRATERPLCKRRSASRRVNASLTDRYRRLERRNAVTIPARRLPTTKGSAHTAGCDAVRSASKTAAAPRPIPKIHGRKNWSHQARLKRMASRRARLSQNRRSLSSAFAMVIADSLVPACVDSSELKATSHLRNLEPYTAYGNESELA